MINSNKYVCIFGGGAVRGIAYIGAIKALRELEINIDTLVGSSVGAIFASLCAVDYSTEEIKEILYDFNAFLFKDISLTIGVDFAFSKGDVFENWIREAIEKKFYGEKYKKGENPPVSFRDINKSLYILSTDLASNSQFIFSKNNTPDFEVAKAVRISAGFPGLMKPVEYQDKLLVDGDLAKSLPLWKASSELMKTDCRILEFRLEGCKNCVNIKNVFDYFNTVYSSMSNFCSEHIIEMYKDKDKFDYILIDTKDILLLDFQMQNDTKDILAENGYTTTINYFTKTLVEKKKRLLPLYEDILAALKELRPFIKKGNVSSAKRVLSDFVCLMSDNYCDLDDSFMENFDKFKISVLKDITKYNIIPVQKLKRKTEHLKILQGLIETLENKITCLTEYINNYSNYNSEI